LVSTAIVSISEHYTAFSNTEIKARLSRALTWTFVVPRQDAKHHRPNNDRGVAPTDPDDYASNEMCASPWPFATPFLGELAREMGG
jgi:hypothetical protein